jgi:hypothetical protein
LTLIQVSSGNPSQYKVNYVVSDCSGTPISAASVIAAVNTVPSSQENILFGFTVSGTSFAQSPAVPTVTLATSSDRKLWIIGAVLGPVAFVLLLVGLALFLHFKCRPRIDNTSTAQVYTYNLFGIFHQKIFFIFLGCLQCSTVTCSYSSKLFEKEFKFKKKSSLRIELSNYSK